MTDSNAPAHPPVPFQEVTTDTYAQAFASSCSVTPSRRGVLLGGICPRCGDQMHFQVVTEIFLATADAGPAPARTASEDKSVMCTCGTTHPGTPPGDEGCGAYWHVTLSGPVS